MKVDKINSVTFYLKHPSRRIIYGNNEIKVEVQSIIRILFLEVLNPFYVFQIFSITLWLTDGYIYFAIAITVMSIAGIASTIVQTRKVSEMKANICIFPCYRYFAYIIISC